MIETKSTMRLTVAAALLGCTALLAACGPAPTTETTTTSQRTTTMAMPTPATTVTTTRTQQITP